MQLIIKLKIYFYISFMNTSKPITVIQVEDAIRK